VNVGDETKLKYELRAKAWKVYWFLLKTGSPLSVREVQRALHFSSPSVAHHHLEQLRELGWVGLGLNLNAKKGKKVTGYVKSRSKTNQATSPWPLS
jgi:SOS-response transcriptional repressor LexA